MSTAVDDLLSEIPIDQLAGRLGADSGTTEEVIRTALPALLGGMEANAQDPAGAASLEQAIGEHDSALVENGIDLDQVDTSDGEKIVGNVFGDNRDQVISQLGASGSGGGSLIGKLLPLLAPIAMAYLAKQFKQRSATSGGDGGGGLADILGGALGGGGAGGGQGLDLGSVLGGLLGGGKR
jgi:hypothetical protein